MPSHASLWKGFALFSLVSLLYASPALAEKKKKILFIGIDGLRTDALMTARAPRLKSLIREGSFAPDAMADKHTRSGPGWASIVTGVWHEDHGVRGNGFGTYLAGAYPHFFSRIKEANPGLRTVSIVNWEPINRHLVRNADLALAPAGDDSVAALAIKQLSEGDPDVMFLHFDAPDHAGHSWGFSRFSPPYLWAIRRTDDRVGKVLDALKARPGREREEWLIIATTDHGGHWRHHGMDIPACRRIPLIVAGDAAARGGALHGAALVDVAPTVLAFLGIPVDPAWRWKGKSVGLRADEEISMAKPDSSAVR